MKSSAQRAGSGRYAVTRTAGRSAPAGIPHTTWIGPVLAAPCLTSAHGPFAKAG